MSFYSELDESGKKIYDDYIKAQNAWFDYVRQRSNKKFSDHLNETNRKFYRYEYYTSQTCMTDKEESTDDNKKLYKLLSKKFHPDRFHKVNSDKFFAKINKAISVNDTKFLELIKEKTDEILQFSDDDFTEFYKSLDNNDANTDTNTSDFSETYCYQFYMNKKSKKDIEYMFLTEEELIEEIESHYDLNFVIACIKRFEKENVRLKQENDILKEQLNKLKEKQN